MYDFATKTVPAGALVIAAAFVVCIHIFMSMMPQQQLVTTSIGPDADPTLDPDDLWF